MNSSLRMARTRCMLFGRNFNCFNCFNCNTSTIIRASGNAKFFEVHPRSVSHSCIVQQSTVQRGNTVAVRGLSTGSTSLESTSTSSSTASSLSSSLTTTTTTSNLNNDWVPRRGFDDEIVTVTVSDQEFKTLKSTLQLSPVIWEALLAAEKQKEDPTSPTTVFLDRDPKHFPVILAYLRNKIDDLSYNRECGIKPVDKESSRVSEVFKRKSVGYFADTYTKYIQLPKDADATELEDLYLEATYYQLEDLQSQLQHGTMTVWALNFFNGEGSIRTNPFERAKEMIKITRNTSIVFAGMGTGVWTYLADTTHSVTDAALSLVG